ncbi:unnamed protein product, partial [marine sediment metagenome]
MDIQKEPKHRIQLQQFTPEKSKNKIEPSKLDASQVPNNKIDLPKIEAKNNKNFDTNNPNRDQTRSNQNIKNDTFNLEKIKEEIKKLDWKSTTENWNITNNPNRYVKHGIITLDPTKEPSRQNPLYRHKIWLQTVYNNTAWNLNGTKLGKICGVDQRTISRWQKTLQIPIKPQYAQQNLFYDSKSKE